MCLFVVLFSHILRSEASKSGYKRFWFAQGRVISFQACPVVAMKRPERRFRRWSNRTASIIASGMALFNSQRMKVQFNYVQLPVLLGPQFAVPTDFGCLKQNGAVTRSYTVHVQRHAITSSNLRSTFCMFHLPADSAFTFVRIGHFISSVNAQTRWWDRHR